MRESIRKARELIERVGWCQKRSIDYDYSASTGRATGYCIYGALLYSNGGIIEPGIEAHLASMLEGPGKFDYISFNDAPGRTKDEVIDFLKRAERRAPE